LLIIILNLVCQDVLEDFQLIVALFLILLVMRMKEHVLIFVLGYSSHKIAHVYASMVAPKCNSLIAFFTVVSLIAMASVDNMPTIQQIVAWAFVLPSQIPLLITQHIPV
jgi:hypothetical protein